MKRSVTEEEPETVISSEQIIDNINAKLPIKEALERMKYDKKFERDVKLFHTLLPLSYEHDHQFTVNDIHNYGYAITIISTLDGEEGEEEPIIYVYKHVVEWWDSLVDHFYQVLIRNEYIIPRSYKEVILCGEYCNNLYNFLLDVPSLDSKGESQFCGRALITIINMANDLKEYVENHNNASRLVRTWLLSCKRSKTKTCEKTVLSCLPNDMVNLIARETYDSCNVSLPNTTIDILQELQNDQLNDNYCCGECTLITCDVCGDPDDFKLMSYCQIDGEKCFACIVCNK